MLLRNITTSELTDIYRRNADRSPAPYLLRDSTADDKVRKLAKKNDIWNELTNLDATRSIPVLKRSEYRNFQRIGDRSVPEAKANYRRRELELATLALWLDHPNADVDYLQDLMWAYCDDWTWVMAAHEDRMIDLGSVRIGRTLAEVLHVLGNRLEDEVKERVEHAVEQHIFEPFRDYRRVDSWDTKRMNWNHVCNGEIIRTALYQIEDPAILAHLTHPAIQNSTYALDGYADDGGCREGPGYWGYGFGHYLKTAYALYLKTNGELNIMADNSGKIERICRYPLAAHIDGPLRATFGDSHHGYMSPHIALLVNEFYQIPELYSLCDLHPDNTLKIQFSASARYNRQGLFSVPSLHGMAMYSDFKVDSNPPSEDFYLPDLGQVKLRGAPGRDQVTVMCLAGNNGVPHNHNDIGSFIVYKHDQLLLVDPGGPRYSRKTFGPDRYDIMFCNSLGHSVPIINQVMQQEGSCYFGTLAVENLNGKGMKKAVIDITGAYPGGTVQQLIRKFELDTEKNIIYLSDMFEFDKPPSSLEEGFITFEEVRVNGESVRIGTETNSVVLSAENRAGRFKPVRLEEESREGKTGQVVTRIRFVPDMLDQKMHLKFKIASRQQLQQS